MSYWWIKLSNIVFRPIANAIGINPQNQPKFTQILRPSRFLKHQRSNKKMCFCMVIWSTDRRTDKPTFRQTIWFSDSIRGVKTLRFTKICGSHFWHGTSGFLNDESKKLYNIKVSFLNYILKKKKIVPIVHNQNPFFNGSIFFFV